MGTVYFWIGCAVVVFIAMMLLIALYIKDYYVKSDPLFLPIALTVMFAATLIALMLDGANQELYYFNRINSLEDKYGLELYRWINDDQDANRGIEADFKWYENGQECYAYYSERSENTLVNKSCTDAEVPIEEVEIDD